MRVEAEHDSWSAVLGLLRRFSLCSLSQNQPYDDKLEIDYVKSCVFIWTGVRRRSRA